MNNLKAYFMTGLPGSGKTTTANKAQHILFEEHDIHSLVLDGDEIRKGLNKDLNFSEEGRLENIRRIAEVSKILLNSSIIPIVATVTPTDTIRNLAKEILTPEKFSLVWIHCKLEDCLEKRNRNIFYENLRNEQGIINPKFFETPERYDILINTHLLDITQSAQLLVEKIVLDTLQG
jgi:adenylylsulfate kinase-like enzyme